MENERVRFVPNPDLTEFDDDDIFGGYNPQPVYELAEDGKTHDIANATNADQGMVNEGYSENAHNIPSQVAQRRRRPAQDNRGEAGGGRQRRRPRQRQTQQKVKRFVTGWEGVEDLTKDEISKIQEAMFQIGKERYNLNILPKFGADGIWGTETERATGFVQSKLGLPITKRWDEKFLRAIATFSDYKPTKAVIRKLAIVREKIPGPGEEPTITPTPGVPEVKDEAAPKGVLATVGISPFDLSKFALTAGVTVIALGGSWYLYSTFKDSWEQKRLRDARLATQRIGLAR